MENTNYKATIREASKPLTARERIKIKDHADALNLNEITENGSVIINVDYFAVLDIHNEASDNKDYIHTVVADKDGTLYYTGSESFYKSFLAIYTEMVEALADGEEEEIKVKVFQKESNNYRGKNFITCAVV